MPPKHKFNYAFTDKDGKNIKIQPSENLILEHSSGQNPMPSFLKKFLDSHESIELDVTYNIDDHNVTFERVNVCKCPRCGAEPPLFIRDEEDNLLYGHCPNCDFKSIRGGEDLKSAADGWNKTVEFVAQDLYWRLTQTGPYTPEETHDEP